MPIQDSGELEMVFVMPVKLALPDFVVIEIVAVVNPAAVLSTCRI